MSRFVPGLAVLRSWDRSRLRPDLLAGVTVWAMLVPQSLGYAELAGIPPANGLYGALGALLCYWLWGSSRQLSVGPETTVAIMVASALGPLAAVGSPEYLKMTATLALLVGVVLVIAGLLRLGRVADFLSRPILAGYVFGSGILIILSQVPRVLGIKTRPDLDLRGMLEIFRGVGKTNVAALLLGLGAIAVVLLFKRFLPKIPGALVAVVLAVIAVSVWHPEVKVVGPLPSGFPIPALPLVPLSQAVKLIGPALAIALLVYPDSIVTGRALAAFNRDRLDGNREFFGIGAANIGSAIFKSFPVNGSQSRSFVLRDAGAKSQIANLWAALFVLLTLLFFGRFFANLPTAALGGIVTVAGFGLLDTKEFSALWRYRRIEFWMGIATILGVLILGVMVGILVAVGLSLLEMVVRVSSPSTAFLGRVPETDTYRDVDDHPAATTVPGLVIYRFDAPIFFANAGKLREDILGAVDKADPPARAVLLDAESIYDIDSTGADVLHELLGELDERSIGFAMARVRTEIRDELTGVLLEARFAGEGVYLEIDDGVRAFQRGELVRPDETKLGSPPG